MSATTTAPAPAASLESERKLGRQPTVEDTTAPLIAECGGRLNAPPPFSYNETYGVDHLPAPVTAMLAKDEYAVSAEMAAGAAGKYAVVDHLSMPWIHASVQMFGHAILGIDVPYEWMEAEDVLDTEDDRFSTEGGTVVVVVGYGPYGSQPDFNPQTINGAGIGLSEYQVVAWGKLFRMTERALQLVTREAYVMIDREFYDQAGFSAEGFDWDALAKPRPAPEAPPAQPEATPQQPPANAPGSPPANQQAPA